MQRWNVLFCLSVAATLCPASGCGKPDGATAQPKQIINSPASGQDFVTASDHSGWWCREHGVPEAECALCDSQVAAEFQKRGDWCEEHDRPKTQCFACYPELKARFAARYEAKFGEPPPQP